MFWFLIILSLVFVFFVLNSLKKRAFVDLFKQGNVLVSGMRGKGKDVAFCVVVNARKRDYISNVNYSSPKKRYKCFPLDLKVWELAGNTHNDLVSGNVKKYTYPYPDNLDYYISDAAIYFPAQYAVQLCNKYRSAPIFQALSRQLGDCNVHTNSQDIGRVWDKIREQSDIYLRMLSCKFIPHTKICRLSAYVYERYDTAQARINLPRFGIGKRAREARYNFEIAHGKIQKLSFFTRLPYNFDSRRFKKILENGCIDYENS